MATSLKKFQRKVIDAVLDGKDALVVYPTGSGKSLCSQVFYQLQTINN